jgi:hypothetical protein
MTVLQTSHPPTRRAPVQRLFLVASFLPELLPVFHRPPEAVPASNRF